MAPEVAKAKLGHAVDLARTLQASSATFLDEGWSSSCDLQLGWPAARQGFLTEWLQ